MDREETLFHAALEIEDPHIAKVLDAGATDTGRPYFVMELVRGIPITEFCDKRNLTTRERLEFFSSRCPPKIRTIGSRGSVQASPTRASSVDASAGSETGTGSGQGAPSFAHRSRTAISVSDNLSRGGISSPSTVCSTDWTRRLDAASPGIKAGPLWPPVSSAFSESVRSPPRCSSGPWHEKQRAARIDVARSCSGESEAGSARAASVTAIPRPDISAGKASLGSWVTYGLGTENQDLPGYVMLFDAGPLGGAANYSNGFLPPAFQPTRLRDRGTPVLDLLPPESFADGQRQSLDLLRDLNLRHREHRAEFAELDARIASYELAYRMQSSALEVGDIEREPDFVRREYGLEHKEPRTQSFGRKCLLARRLAWTTKPSASK